MSITDPGTEPAETVAEAAAYIRQRLIAIVNGLSRELQAIHAKLVMHTSSAIATEVGDDAGELQSLYNAGKAIANGVFGEGGTSPNADKVVPNLPA